MDLNYPGGIEIEKLAKEGNENFYITKTSNNEENFNFSFSGIKTHINLLVKKNKLDDYFVRNLSASFQKTIVDIISSKLITGLDILNQKKIQIKSISVVGRSG